TYRGQTRVSQEWDYNSGQLLPERVGDADRSLTREERAVIHNTIGQGTSYQEFHMLLNNVEPEKWYTVRQTSEILGWSIDSIRRWIYKGHLQAFIRPGRGIRRARIYNAARILGAEIIRFVKEHLTPRK